MGCQKRNFRFAGLFQFRLFNNHTEFHLKLLGYQYQGAYQHFISTRQSFTLIIRKKEKSGLWDRQFVSRGNFIFVIFHRNNAELNVIGLLLYELDTVDLLKFPKVCSTFQSICFANSQNHDVIEQDLPISAQKRVESKRV